MVIAILGTAGSGKSFLLDRMLAKDPNRPVVLIGLRGDPSYRNCGKWPWHVLTRVPRAVRLRKRERVGLDLTPLTAEEAEWVINRIMAEVMRLEGGVIAIDEAHLYLTHPSPELVRFIRGSRHFGLKVYIATQRWVDIHPQIRAVVRHLFVMRTVSGRDLTALGAEPGLDVEKVPRLKVGEYEYVRR